MVKTVLGRREYNAISVNDLYFVKQNLRGKIWKTLFCI